MFTLLSFSEFLLTLPMAIEAHNAHALERAAKVVEKEAKDSIGEYQDTSGPFVAWQDLADSTVTEKERLGFSPGDNPELRTGEMRDSIFHFVDAKAGKAFVGSNSDVLVYQELGTENMPPRSILGGALARKSHEIEKILGDSVKGALLGDGVHNGRMDI